MSFKLTAAQILVGLFALSLTNAIILHFPQLALKATIKDAGPDSVNVTLEAPEANDLMSHGYMALGFSPTGGMSGSFIVECIPSTGEIFGSLASGHNKPIRASHSHLLKAYGITKTIGVHRCHAAVKKNPVVRSVAIVAAIGLIERNTTNQLSYHAGREAKSSEGLKKELKTRS